ncbi:MAG TPA: sigma-70 family RNA polymerase sigma factor [Bryobacteraceae bacterium]|nr:sigma-70 family RNA polymerase sigma factor [Bryobacteraceae bacterium]
MRLTASRIHSSQTVSSFKSDGVLVDGLRLKDPQAMEDLYGRFEAVVRRAALGIVKDPAMSEDVVQETFSRVWVNSHRIASDTQQIGPWIVTIAKNIARDALRRSKHQSFYLESVLAQIPAQRNTEECIISEEQKALVLRALRSLGRKPRLVIELAYFQDMSQSEIAKHLKQPLGTVKNWTRSGLAHLRNVLSIKIQPPQN